LEWSLNKLVLFDFTLSVNVARNKQCTQSSPFTDNPHPATYAVNGNTDGRYNDYQNCIQTGRNEENPWWQVDLGHVYPIHHMVIWGRTEAGSELDFFFNGQST
jgi:hypothetical protein